MKVETIRIVSSALLWIIMMGALNSLYASEKQGFELGVYWGSLDATGGISQQVDEDRDLNTQIVRGSAAGLKAVYNFAYYHLAVETVLGVSTNDHTVRLFDSSLNWAHEPEEASIQKTTELFFLNTNALLFPLGGVFSPFVTAGAGWIAFVDNAPVAINYGGGIRCILANRIVLRFDIRKFDTKLNGKIGQIRTHSFYPYIREEQIPFSDQLTFTEISGGISFLFHPKR
jgi:hypothetical protein